MEGTVVVDVRVAGTSGHIHQVARDRAREKITRVLVFAPAPVLDAAVTLAVMDNPAVTRPAFASARLDVNGHLVRARVSATTLAEAIDLLEAKLRHELEIMRGHRLARRRPRRLEVRP